jgi:molybdopterin/thiamine biosynthesis adenylyltransferase
MSRLSPEEIVRYSRHILLREVGGRGQERLRAARAAIVGAGGLGSPAALYLAAAGVGRITLVDSDAVDPSNLQRQILHRDADVGRPKAESGRDTLAALNPGVSVRAVRGRLDEGNAAGWLADHDVVLEGSDNLDTKYIVNRTCVARGIPFVLAGVLRFEGQVMCWRPGAACYRCLFRDPPEPGCLSSCDRSGVLGAVAGVIGCLQASEALKILLGTGTGLFDRILVFDALTARFREVALRRDPACPDCGTARQP